jgi:hypothetical protein
MNTSACAAPRHGRAHFLDTTCTFLTRATSCIVRQSRCTNLDALFFEQLLYLDQNNKLSKYQVAQSSTA